jgi:hypothetical protein
MKKILVISLLAFIGSVGHSAQMNVDTYVDITASSITAVGVLTNSFTIPGRKGRVMSLIGVYQDVDATAQTNTVVITLLPKGAPAAVTLETLAAVIDTSAYETVGEGDVSADIDPILLLDGDVFTFTGTGADSTNMSYIVKFKLTNQ